MSKRGKLYIIDDRQYRVFIKDIGFNYEKKCYNVKVTMKAEYGSGSYYTISGLTNIHKWDDRRETPPNTVNHIQITPASVARLVRYLLQKDWDPVESKSNRTLNLSNIEYYEIVGGMVSDER